MTHIGVNAFEGCLLTDVSLPDGLLLVEGDAFKSSSLLREITLPDSVTDVRGYAFFTAKVYNKSC